MPFFHESSFCGKVVILRWQVLKNARIKPFLVFINISSLLRLWILSFSYYTCVLQVTRRKLCEWTIALESSSSSFFFFSTISKGRTSLRNALGVKNACHLKLRPGLAVGAMKFLLLCLWTSIICDIRREKNLLFLKNKEVLDCKKSINLDFVKTLGTFYNLFTIYYYKIHLCI